MQRLSSDVVLRAWEAGSVRQGVHRTLAVLAAIYPERTERDLERLPLGARDRLLAGVYESAFGSEMRGYVTCPACSERLELTLPVRALGSRSAVEENVEFSATRGNLDLTLRLPDSSDIAASAAAPDVAEARRVLVDRCVLHARRGGADVDNADLSEDEIAFAGEEISHRDPQTETTLQLRCAVCGYVSDSGLDIGAFLWAELSALARRLLFEVHQLAAAYGWSEHDILHMNAFRRRQYLELASR